MMRGSGEWSRIRRGLASRPSYALLGFGGPVDRDFSPRLRSVALAGYDGGVKIDPIALLTRTADHLRAHPNGHIAVGIGQFVISTAVAMLAICGGLGGSLVIGVASAILAAASDGGAGQVLATLVSLLIYPFMFFGMLLILPPLVLVYLGYQSATLDEVDGKEDVTIGKVIAIVTGSVGALLALVAVLCGLNLVGVMMCYVGVFFTALPFRYAHLIRYDRKVGVGEALGLAWRGFMAEPGTHAIIFVVEMVISMVLAYIPLIGPAIVWPVLSVFDTLAYRELYPAEGAIQPSEAG